MSSKSAEVAVIGAGLAGLSCAYFCAKAGLTDVVILEKDGIFSKASGANHGGVGLSPKFVDIPTKEMLADRGLRTIKEFATEENVDLEFKETGFLTLFWSQNKAEVAKKIVRREQEAGYVVSFLDQKELRKVEPEISQFPLGAIYYPHEAQLNPLKLAGAFYERGRRMGVKVLHFTKAEGFKYKGDQITTICTNQGEISVSVVVNAAGPWSSELNRLMGMDVPTIPVKGQALVTECVPQIIRNVINDQIGIQQTQNGNIIAGGTAEQVGFSTQVTHDVIKFICEETTLLFPKLSKVSVLRVYSALRALSPDTLPLIGEVCSLRSAYVISGLYTPGILFGSIGGKLVAELITKNIRDPLLASFSPSRFINGNKRNEYCQKGGKSK